MKLGVVDVGGGLRDIYGLGIFDYCIDAGIHFDVCVGVSAGSANVASYLSGQRNRNYPFYTDYPFRKEYMSLRNYLKRGEFLNLDYIYDDLCCSGGENPIDYPALEANPAKMIVVATNTKTAAPVYFTKADIAQDQYNVFKASSSIPLVCKPHECSGIPCFDGALSDPIPFGKAFEEGCEKVVVILTRPRNVLRVPGKDKKIAALLRWKYPKAAEAMKNRYRTYNEQAAQAKELEKEGKLLILAPDSIEGLDTLSRNLEALEHMYRKGYRDAEALKSFFC